MFLINKSFLNKIIEKEGLKIEIKRILSIKIRNLNIKEYDIYEYVIIFIYIPYKNGMIVLI